MSAPALEFREVSHAFLSRDGSEVHALDRLSFSVAPGEFLAIVGPSGCGKSTALRLVAGLEAPTRGEVLVEGRTGAEAARAVGMVFQKPTLLHWLTVERNVLMPVRVARGRAAAAAEAPRARALLEMVGLGQFGAKLPHELSGGMQQRAAICRALIQDPDILLMDEPFGALDALTREEMCFELLRIWERSGKTIVFITHSIPEAVLLADRVLVMSPRPGRLAAEIKVGVPRPRSLESMATRAFGEDTQRIREIIYGHRPAADRPTL